MDGLGDLTTVDADPDRLRQAIGNLVTNAVRATPPVGSVTLHADRPDGVRGTVIAVSDTGCGIGPEDLPKVFDRFWRADAARPRHRRPGTGHQRTRDRPRARRHAHHRQHPGTGSTFTIRLPATG
ncbi:sensor histidine kinase [Spirillospora sp. CA-255316]